MFQAYAPEPPAYIWSADELARFNAYMASTAPLWKPAPADKEGRRAHFVAEIAEWIANRKQRSYAYMSPAEIGKAEDRGFLLRRALVDSIAAYYRQNKLAPIAPGVLVLDTAFSDNPEGRSSVSAARLAKLLGCDEKAVRRARALLANDGLLGRAKHKGLSDQHWPIVNRSFAGQELHPVWWLDATSEPPAPRGNHSGKPRTKPRTQRARCPCRG